MRLTIFTGYTLRGVLPPAMRAFFEVLDDRTLADPRRPQAKLSTELRWRHIRSPASGRI